MTTLVTIVVGLPPHTKEPSAQNEDSYIPGVFILTDSVKKIQDQLKNEKHKQEESAKVTENEQGTKVQVIYHQDSKEHDEPTKKPTMVNHAPVPVGHVTNQNSLASNRLYMNQNQGVTYHTYPRHYPSEKDTHSIQNQNNLNHQIIYPNQQYGLHQMPYPSDQQYVLNHGQNQPPNEHYFINGIPNRPVLLNQIPNQQITNQPPSNQQYILVTQPLTNQQVLQNQPLTNQQYLSNQNPSQALVLNQQPPITFVTQNQPFPTNQMPTQGISTQPVLLLQPSQNGQSIVLTQQPNQAVFQPNQLAYQNGQLGQASNLLVASNQNVNQPEVWPKPAQNQAVYTLVSLDQNSVPSANGHNYLVSVPSS